MRQIDTATAKATRNAAAAPGTEGWWTKGDPGVSEPATIIDEDFLNDLQANIFAVYDAASIAHTKGTGGDDGLLDALRALISYATPSSAVGHLQYVNASSVRITPAVLGDIACMIDGVLVKKTGNLTFDMASHLIPSEAASTPYYLYVQNVSGVLTPHIDSVRPYLPGEVKPGYHSSGGGLAGYLCVGSFWNDPSQDIVPARWGGHGWAEFFERVSDHVHALGTTVPTAWTAQALELPLCASAVRLVHTATGECYSVVFGASDAPGTLPTGASSGGYAHSFGASTMIGVLVRMHASVRSESSNDCASGQFEIPISDPTSPGIRWGNLQEWATPQITFNEIAVNGYQDIYAPRW